MAEGGDLASKLRADLPEEAMKLQPQRGFLAIPLIVLIVTGTWAVMTRPMPWYASLLVSFVIGNLYGSLAFLGHETIHGSVFHARWAQNLVGYPAFFIFGFTPTLWRVWHNQVHHIYVNVPDVDPDSYGTLKRFAKIPLAKFQFKSGVGSGHILTALFFFYRFSYHSQVVLWMISKRYKDYFQSLDRRRAQVESLCLVAFWIALAVLAGLRGAFFGIVIPMATANAILMSYIATNHFLRPLMEYDEPVDDSMSVTVPKWVDALHFNFSYHTEHHYFPNMSPKFAPIVRRSLLRYVPDRYLSPPLWKAVLWLYKTPRLYKDAHTLIDPYKHREVSVDEVDHILHEAMHLQHV